MRWTIAAAALALAGAAQAGEEDRGRQVYMEACATCHGEAGRGDGPMAELLTLPVPDLTGLAARNGGEFPWLWLVQLIGEGGGLRGHGGPMPVFGPILGGEAAVADAPDGTPVIAPEPILAVVDHLRRLQAP